MRGVGERNMSIDIYNKMAIQFADSNRQEQGWLREEIMELKLLLAAVALGSGGHRAVANTRDIAMLRSTPREWDIESKHDPDNQRYIIQVVPATQQGQ